MGYQLAFDIYESATQQLVGRIVNSLSMAAPIPAAATVTLRVPPILTASANKPEATVEVTEASTVVAAPEKDINSLVCYKLPFVNKVFINI